jgi:hypothetical protein
MARKRPKLSDVDRLLVVARWPHTPAPSAPSAAVEVDYEGAWDSFLDLYLDKPMRVWSRLDEDDRQAFRAWLDGQRATARTDALELAAGLCDEEAEAGSEDARELARRIRALKEKP